MGSGWPRSGCRLSPVLGLYQDPLSDGPRHSQSGPGGWVGSSKFGVPEDGPAPSPAPSAAPSPAPSATAAASPPIMPWARKPSPAPIAQPAAAFCKPRPRLYLRPSSDAPSQPPSPPTAAPIAHPMSGLLPVGSTRSVGSSSA